MSLLRRLCHRFHGSARSIGNSGVCAHTEVPKPADEKVFVLPKVTRVFDAVGCTQLDGCDLGIMLVKASVQMGKTFSEECEVITLGH